MAVKYVAAPFVLLDFNEISFTVADEHLVMWTGEHPPEQISDSDVDARWICRATPDELDDLDGLIAGLQKLREYIANA